MQYTSHMTGVISLAADNVAMGEYAMGVLFMGYILCFVIGAVCTPTITLYFKRYHLHSRFALPLLVEALILTVFSLSWIWITPHSDKMPYFIAMLCFVMGLQNALITKVSSAIIRTTHITGMTTDLGIEIGRFLMGVTNPQLASPKTNILRHTFMILAFFIGGIGGAMGVHTIGTLTFLVIAFLLVALGYPQFARDYLLYIKILKRKRMA